MLLLFLRWRLFLNSLRRTGRRAEVAFQALFILFGAGFVLITSGAFFGLTMAFLKIGRNDLLDFLLWAVLLVWQLAPILLEGYSPGLNFTEVARYPISFRSFFLLSSAYGVSDPAAITCVLWLAAMWIGVAVARPAWAAGAALVLLLFAAFNLLLNRIVIGLFERFQSTRKGRERMVFLMFILILLPQVLQFATGYWTNMRIFALPSWLMDLVTPLRQFSPPGRAIAALSLHGGTEWAALGGLMLYLGLALFLLWRQLHSIYLGEIYAERYTARKEMKVEPGWRLPLVDDATAAIMEKEFRYARQSSRFLLQLVYSPIVFILLALNGPAHKLFFTKTPEAMLAGMAGFILLSVPNVAYNTFGMDNEGFGRWLLCPVSFRKVLVGKNLTNAAMIGALYLLAQAAIILIAHPPALPTVTVTIAFFTILVIQLGAGNLISVYWPKRIELSKMSSKMVSGAAGIASLLVSLPVIAIAAIVSFAAWYWQLPWLPLLGALIGLVASLKLYSYLLDRSAAYAWEHIEELSGNLGA